MVLRDTSVLVHRVDPLAPPRVPRHNGWRERGMLDGMGAMNQVRAVVSPGAAAM